MTGRSHPLDRVPGLRELARTQCGVVRREQLRELGVLPHHVRAQLEAERWTAYGRSVVVLSTGVLTREQRRAVAVARAGPRAALGGPTALEALGLRGWDREAIHVVVPKGHRVAGLVGLTVHQARHLDAGDLVPRTWPACTGAARAAIDAASWERHPRTASGLVVAVVQQRLATAYDVSRALERPGPVRHRALLRSVLADALEGADALSEIEVARLVRSVGLPEPRRQVEVLTPDGLRRVDLAVDLPDGRTLVIEVDGPLHADPWVREDDAVKDAALLAAGYVVLHIPVTLLHRRPDVVRAQLAAIARRARLAA